MRIEEEFNGSDLIIGKQSGLPRLNRYPLVSAWFLPQISRQVNRIPWSMN